MLFRSSAPNGLINARLSTVIKPTWRNARGELMFVVSGTFPGTTVFGMFGGDDFSDLHWERLGDLPLDPSQSVWSSASYDGSLIYFGTTGRRLFRFTSADGQITEVNLPLPKWHSTDGEPNCSTIHQIVMASPQIAFATFNHDCNSPNGTVYRTVDGNTWINGGIGLPETFFYALSAHNSPDGTQVFAASDDRVFMSRSDGAAWSDFSSGLPRRPLNSDLRVFADERDNSHWLYLSTFGRSVWRTLLLPPHQILYVNGDYNGTMENGTFENPYKTVTAARDAAVPGATLRILPASYRETPTVTKALTLEAYSVPVTIRR